MDYEAYNGPQRTDRLILNQVTIPEEKIKEISNQFLSFTQ